MGKIKFGREVLRLDTWYAVLQYQWFCKILGPGINLHLASNHMLREIFELGNPLPVLDGSSTDKPSKEERNAANQLARKIHTGGELLSSLHGHNSVEDKIWQIQTSDCTFQVC